MRAVSRTEKEDGACVRVCVGIIPTLEAKTADICETVAVAAL